MRSQQALSAAEHGRIVDLSAALSRFVQSRLTDIFLGPGRPRNSRNSISSRGDSKPTNPDPYGSQAIKSHPKSQYPIIRREL